MQKKMSAIDSETMKHFMDKLAKKFDAFVESEGLAGGKVLPTETKVIPMDHAFETTFLFPYQQFKDSLKTGVLYRPDIVDEMETKLMNLKNGNGLFVRGPKGIGKSHSLYNLVQMLRSKGHLVTYMPRYIFFGFDLWKAICRSFKTDPFDLEGIDIGISSQISNGDLDVLMHLIKYIHKNQLKRKRWFFVFDEMEKILDVGREVLKTNDIESLAHPFNLIKLLNNLDGITTVLTTNAAYGKYNYAGFENYDHKLRMTETEFRVWMKKKDPTVLDWSEWRIAWLANMTGYSPSQVNKYIEQGINYSENYDHKLRMTETEFWVWMKKNDPTVLAWLELRLARLTNMTGYSPLQVSKYIEQGLNYSENAMRSIDSGLNRYKPGDRESIAKAAIHCLLGIKEPESSVGAYDRNFLIRYEDGSFEPTFPLVLVYYRIVFRNELNQYIEKNEENLLEVCRSDSGVSNDARGRIFELLIINRFRKNTKSREPPRYKLSSFFKFCWTLFVPEDSRCIIDFALKSSDGKSVWAVKTHVAEQDDVLPDLDVRCEVCGWFKGFETIHLVYLSPCDRVRKMLKFRQTLDERRTKRTKLSVKNIIVSAITVDQIQCLTDLHWT